MSAVGPSTERRAASATPASASMIPASFTAPSGSPDATPAVTGTTTASEPTGVTMLSGPSDAAR